MVSVGIAVARVEQFEGYSREIFGGRHAVEHDGLVAGHRGEKIGDLRVAAIDEERVIPGFDHMAHGDGLDLRKVHHHAVVRLAGGFDDIADQSNFDGITMPVQVAALALVVGDAMPGVELEAARDLHGIDDNLGVANYIPATLSMPSNSDVSGRLSVADHSRDSAGMTYVYPVVSRRAGGVSVGINLNPNNACNWRCIYCQVPDLKRGGPPPLDFDRLEVELRTMLTQLFRGDYLERHAPPEARRVVDIAFSGNGEPTSAPEFPEVVERVGQVLDEFALAEPPLLRLISNGSLLDRNAVRRGIAMIGARNGEVWFKIDAVGSAAMNRINGVGYQPETVLRRLLVCGELCATWVQTCLFAFDGKPSNDDVATNSYLDLLGKARERLRGVHLYGLARPSRQPEATRLMRLSTIWMEALAKRIEDETGLTVKVSP
jgi:wyosine [tRNA(Phe)-imidazoG37] synthetase (radical SAM superfamily)